MAAVTKAVSANSACWSCRPRWTRTRCTAYPPISAPAAKATRAITEASREKPAAPAKANP